MRIKLSQIYVLSLYAALIGQACMFIGLPFEMGTVASFGTYLIAGASMVCLFAWLIDGRRGEDMGKALFILLAVFTAFSIIYSWSFSFDILIKVITFLELPIFLLTAEKMKSEKAKKAIYAFNMLYPVLFAVLFASPFSHRYYGEYGMVEHENITLGYGNPNEAGIYLMINFIILIAALFKFKNLLLKLICIAEAAFIGYLVFLTDSRSAIIVILLVIVGSLIFRRIRLSRPLLLGVFAVPIFFFFALSWFPDLTILGEEFDTGRSELYRLVFEQLNFEKFIMGDFTGFLLNNMHNALLSVFASLGIFTTVVFVMILYRQIKRLGKTVVTGERKVLLIGALVIILHGAVEAAVLTSGTAYSTLLFMLYYLCLDDTEEREYSLNENTAP